MSVDRESIDNPAQDGKATIVKVERVPAGHWVVSLRIEMAAHLFDGRRIILNRTVNVRATQQLGRKPRAGDHHWSKSERRPPPMEYRLLPNTESVLDAIAREDTIEYSATPGDSGWMRMEPLWPDDQIELWFTMGNSYRFRAQGGGNERS